MKHGKLTENGVRLEPHETRTINCLLRQGKNISLIPRSNIKGVRTADFRMDGIEWEMKSPKGEGKWLLKNILKRAARQSSHVVIDLRRTKIHQTKCLQELEKHFLLSKSLTHMKVITKHGKILDFTK